MTNSTEIRVIEAKAGLYSRIIFGTFCILSGMGAAIWGVWIDHNSASTAAPDTMWTLSHILMIGGAVWAVFGGMILPSVFDAAKPIFTFVFPNGIPIIGGRRKSDPPTPADEATDGGSR